MLRVTYRYARKIAPRLVKLDKTSKLSLKIGSSLGLDNALARMQRRVKKADGRPTKLILQSRQIAALDLSDDEIEVELGTADHLSWAHGTRKEVTCTISCI